VKFPIVSNYTAGCAHVRLLGKIKLCEQSNGYDIRYDEKTLNSPKKSNIGLDDLRYCPTDKLDPTIYWINESLYIGYIEGIIRYIEGIIG